MSNENTINVVYPTFSGLNVLRSEFERKFQCNSRYKYKFSELNVIWYDYFNVKIYLN